jgi:hypothetical protein
VVGGGAGTVVLAGLVAGEVVGGATVVAGEVGGATVVGGEVVGGATVVAGEVVLGGGAVVLDAAELVAGVVASDGGSVGAGVLSVMASALAAVVDVSASEAESPPSPLQDTSTAIDRNTIHDVVLPLDEALDMMMPSMLVQHHAPDTADRVLGPLVNRSETP